MATDTVVLRRFANAMEAELAQIVLEAHGIPSAVLRDDAGGMLPVMSLVFPVRLVVRREDERRATAVLEREEAGDAEEADDHDGDDEPREPWQGDEGGRR